MVLQGVVACGLLDLCNHRIYNGADATEILNKVNVLHVLQHAGALHPRQHVQSDLQKPEATEQPVCMIAKAEIRM